MKNSSVSPEISEIKNDAQKLLIPVVKAHGYPGEVAGLQGEVLKWFPLQLPVHGWLLRWLAWLAPSNWKICNC